MELPHRFVPTTSKFVSPVTIVSQYGHAAAITAVAFSGDSQYFASADADGWARIWSLETLDILGIYLLDFRCETLTWEGNRALVCRGGDRERRIEIELDPEDDVQAPKDVPLTGGIIRLIGEPEASRDGDVLRITYNDQEFVHEIPGLANFVMDPCERYVAAVSPSVVYAFNAYEDETVLELKAPEGRKWCGIHMFWRGSYFSALLDDGSIYIFDAIGKKIDCAMRGRGEICAWNFSDKELILYGDRRGTLTVYDVTEHAILLQTPRCPVTFCAVYPSPEKTGFVALRTESASAFLGQSQEILSAAPLPAAWCASCAGSQYSEVVVACSDSRVYRLKLDDNSIATIATTKGETVDAVAATAAGVFMHYVSGKFAFHDASGTRALAWDSADKPRQVAISESGAVLAALFGDRIELYDRTQHAVVRRIDIADIEQIAFGKEKSANSLIAFRHDLAVISIDIESGESRELNRLDIEHARIVSVAPAAKSFVYVLLEMEHGQIAIMRVGLNSGKSSLVLRVFLVGTQIWGATENSDSVYLRSDATCLRIISGLKAFSVEDWTRSEPLALF